MILESSIMGGEITQKIVITQINKTPFILLWPAHKLRGACRVLIAGLILRLKGARTLIKNRYIFQLLGKTVRCKLQYQEMDVEDHTREDSEQYHFDLDDLVSEEDFECPYIPTPADLNIVSGRVQCFSTYGTRSENQDQFDYVIDSRFTLLAVYDGHGGPTVSLHLKNTLLSTIVKTEGFLLNPEAVILQVISRKEKEIIQNLDDENCGSTLLVVFSDHRGTLVINVGDSTCFGIKQTSETGKTKCSLNQLNEEHTLNSQKQRLNVWRKGALILQRGGSYRVNGVLNLSRSIGDQRLKKYISATPTVNFYPSSIKGNNFTSLILMTDGCSAFVTQCQKKAELQNKTLVESLRKYEHYRDNATFVAVQIPPYHIQ